MAVPTVINLNDSSPAAPAGKQNIKWQVGAGDPRPVSSYDAIMVGDSGSGGLAGNVPAPAAGDSAAGKFLKANGIWTVPPGSSGGASGNAWFNNRQTTGTAALYVAANSTYLFPYFIDLNLTFANIASKFQGSGSNVLDTGIYDVSGNLIADTGPVTPTTGVQAYACPQGSQTINAGWYFMAFTSTLGNSNPFWVWGGTNLYPPFGYSWSGGTTTGGQLNASMTITISGPPGATTPYGYTALWLYS